MFTAQLLQAGSVVYSPWFERQGDYLRPTLDVCDLGSSATIEVRVFTKNKEDTGNGADANSGVTLSLSAVGRDTDEWGPSALKELVRYKFTTATSWVLFRMLPPVWFNAVMV